MLLKKKGVFVPGRFEKYGVLGSLGGGGRFREKKTYVKV